MTGLTLSPAEQAAALLTSADGVLFDFNGTLSLDEELLEQCYGQALVDCGLSPLGSGEYAALIGMSEYAICDALLAERGNHEVSRATLLDAVAQRYLTGYEAGVHFPDLHTALIAHLRSSGIPCGIVTGTIAPMLTPVLEELGISALFDCVVTIDEAGHSKPHPAGFLLGREQLGLTPEHTVVALEDSLAGVAAARAAGLPVILIGAANSEADVTVASLADIARAAGLAPQS